MEFGSVAVVAGLVILYGMVSRKLSERSITGPFVFVLSGIALGAAGLVSGRFDRGAIEVLAEVTLVLLLFTDATRIDLRVLARQAELPARLLAVGLPLTVLAGGLLAWLLLPGLSVWEGMLLGAILAPTDAALGQAVVSDPSVPARIRQALNVESGLNDGIMLPAITVLVAVAAAEIELGTPGFWAGFAARQVGFGILTGAVIGWAGGRALDVAASRGWVEGTLRQLTTLAIGVGAFAVAELLDGNGFVAAFVAGLAFGFAARGHCETAADFAEDQGQLLALLTFLFFGAALVRPALDELTWQVAAYSMLSLTAIRMVPVALSLAGLRLRWETTAILGWFGPRGLASILFGISALEAAHLPGGELMSTTITWTVLASVVLHGLTSVPLTRRYAARLAGSGDGDMPEVEPVELMRLRIMGGPSA